MNLSRWPQADALLDEALARPPAFRLGFIRAAADDDPELLAALEAVVREDGADGFLPPGGAFQGPLADEIMEELASEEDGDRVLGLGDRVGDYVITGVLGRGGMGEVYRARDIKLEREVAIKVLPGRFATDPDRLARFRREARFLASLNHPNIGAIYGIAEREGLEGLVLELVDGPTLAERIAARPLLPEEAVRIARQIALALESAHRLGIIHRDLKPANIKLTPGGTAKVLDFGLARVAAIDDSSARPAGLVTSVIDAPGILLGTASYMSPEQARGAVLDQRTDVWSFGCVLYEMLTGRRAFEGETLADVLAAVLEREPRLDALPAETPEPVRRLLVRCLQKDPLQRVGYLGEALLDLDNSPQPVVPVQLSSPPRSIVRRPALMVAALVGVAIVAGAILWERRDSLEPSRVTRLSLPLPAGEDLTLGSHPVAALSPDGQTLVYRAERAGVLQLFRRSLRQLESAAIAGSEEGAAPFFSPDGKWLGYDADGIIRKLSVSGGSPIDIARAPGGVTASWGPDGYIVFSTNTVRELQRVSAAGGEPVTISRLDQRLGEIAHAQPFVVGGGRTVLFTSVRADAKYVSALRIDTGEVKVLTAGMQPRLLPTGHLLFAREHDLWAARFDARRLALRSETVPVLQGLENSGVVYFTTADDGTAAYVPRRPPASARTLLWLDRSGREGQLPVEARTYVRAALSPDGTRAAAAVDEDDNRDIWVADLQRGTMLRLTSHPLTDTAPLWSPDGRSVVFRSDRDGGGLFRRNADAVGDVERLTRSDGPYHTPYSWSGPRLLLFSEMAGYRLQRIRSVSVDDGSVRTLLDGDFAQLRPRVSPNGRWLAYQSDESGRFEVYLRPFPDVGAARWQVSPSGGTSPRWLPDGRTLIYYDGDGFVSVGVSGGEVPSMDPPSRLFAYKPFMSRLGPDFDISPDGRRLLVVTDVPPTDPVARRAQIVLVQNWFDELRSIIP